MKNKDVFAFLVLAGLAAGAWFLFFRRPANSSENASSAPASQTLATSPSPSGGGGGFFTDLFGELIDDDTTSPTAPLTPANDNGAPVPTGQTPNGNSPVASKRPPAQVVPIKQADESTEPATVPVPLISDQPISIARPPAGVARNVGPGTVVNTIPRGERQSRIKRGLLQFSSFR